jgi:hypothetical protein
MAILTDGFSTRLSFANYPGILLEEKTVTPPGIEGGGAIDNTTMANTTWRTASPKSLKTLTDGSLSAAYDPDVLDTIMTMINENQLITATFPDGSTFAFWGWLDTFEPSELSEGEQPLADCTMVPSNKNDSGVETGPVYSA